MRLYVICWLGGRVRDGGIEKTAGFCHDSCNSVRDGVDRLDSFPTGKTLML